MRRAAFILVLAVAAACGGAEPAAQPTPSPFALDGCVRRSEATVVRLTASDGQEISGAVFGSGPKGVLLGHMGKGNLCAWVEEARRLSAKGYQVLAIDFRGFGASTLNPAVERFGVVHDAVAAIAELRKREAASVIVIGASLGAMAGMQAAATVTPPIQGVIQVSGPTSFPGLDISASIPKVRVPVLFVYAVNDTEVVEPMKAQFKAIASTDKRIVTFPDYEHGTDLFKGLRAEEFSKQIDAFLAKHSA